MKNLSYLEPQTNQVYSDYTGGGNTGDEETILSTYTVPGGMLSTHKDRLRIYANGGFAGNSNSKTVKLQFDGNVLFSYNTTDSSQLDWTLQAEIIQRFTDSIKSWVWFNHSENPGRSSIETDSVTLSSDVVLKITGEAVATSDILLNTLSVEFLPAPL